MIMCIIRKYCISIFIGVFFLICTVGCARKLDSEDIRILFPDKVPTSSNESGDLFKLSYSSDVLSVLELNSYIRVLIDDYDYSIIQEAKKEGDDTIFVMGKDGGSKKISFTLRANGDIDIQYSKES